MHWTENLMCLDSNKLAFLLVFSIKKIYIHVMMNTALQLAIWNAI